MINGLPLIINKEIIDGKLVISKAYPQTAQDLAELIDRFGLVGKHLSKRTLLDFLHFIEGDSESYYKQLHKQEYAIQVFSRKLVGYKGQYGFFSFNITLDSNCVIKNAYCIGRTIPLF